MLARQPSVWVPAQLCACDDVREVRVAAVDAVPGALRRPTSTSPLRSTPVAALFGDYRGDPYVIGVAGRWALDAYTTHRIRKATSTFIAGPAAITAIRFHTGWRK